MVCSMFSLFVFSAAALICIVCATAAPGIGPIRRFRGSRRNYMRYTLDDDKATRQFPSTKTIRPSMPIMPTPPTKSPSDEEIIVAPSVSPNEIPDPFLPPDGEAEEEEEVEPSATPDVDDGFLPEDC